METPKRALALCIAALLLTLGGCKRTEFVIDMQPDGKVMERTVTFNVAGEELDRLAALYGTVPDEETLAELEENRTVKYTVTSRFTSRMPADVGGSGYLLHYASPLGTSSIYSERFRGHDDLAGMIETQRLAFDRLLDVLLLWLDYEIGDESGYDEVRTFLDTELRADLWNILLLANSMDTIGPVVVPPDADVDTFLGMNYGLRVMHYLADRDYIDPLELSRYVMAVNEMDSGSPAPFMEFLADTFSRKIGLDEIPDALEALTQVTDEQLETSWERFNAESDELAALVESWFDDNAVERREFEDGEYLETILDELTGSTVFSIGYGSYLDVTLHIASEPYSSNGLWDEAGMLTWDQRLAHSEPTFADLPNVLYAAWSEPDGEFQKRHFGGTVIEGEEMLEYAMWYESLAAGHQDEWDTFVSILEPGEDLDSRLRMFAFEDEADLPLPDEPGTFRSEIARRALTLISRGLNEVAGSPDAGSEPGGTN